MPDLQHPKPSKPSPLHNSYISPLTQPPPFTSRPTASLQHLDTQTPSSPTQIHTLALTVHTKLIQQADQQDRDFRLLVSHANLLDSLMNDLAEAEELPDLDSASAAQTAQEAPQQSPRTSSPPMKSGERRQLPVDLEEAFAEIVCINDDDDENDAYENGEFGNGAALTRTLASRHNSPELVYEDSDSESEEDEALPSEALPPPPPPPIPGRLNPFSKGGSVHRPALQKPDSCGPSVAIAAW